jgi:cation:H+ antiporter
MLLSLSLLFLGFILLAFAADRLVSGASNLAYSFKISPLLVGITLVALGTSLPEIVVALHAAYQQNPGLAIGNALGSNIANIGLVLGLCAWVQPIKAPPALTRCELPILLLIMLLITLLIIDGAFTQFDGLIILAGLIIFSAWLARQATTPNQTPALIDPPSTPVSSSHYKNIFFIVLGIVLLPLSSHLIVVHALKIAQAFGISKLIIGLTVIALGTSLPEVATAIAATLKKEYALVLGNILGSNIFNLLAVMPLPALLSPAHISKAIIIRDIGMMFVMTIVLYAMLRSKRPISRWQGSGLLALYALYGVILWLTHDNPQLFIRVIP